MWGGTAGFAGGDELSRLRPLMCLVCSFGSSEALLLFREGEVLGVGLLWGLFAAIGLSEPTSVGLDGLSLLLRLVISSLFSTGGSCLAVGTGLGLIMGFGFMNKGGLDPSGFSSCASDFGFGGCLGTGFRLHFFTSLAETLWPHSRPISFRR